MNKRILGALLLIGAAFLCWFVPKGLIVFFASMFILRFIGGWLVLSAFGKKDKIVYEVSFFTVNLLDVSIVFLVIVFNRSIDKLFKLRDVFLQNIVVSLLLMFHVMFFFLIFRRHGWLITAVLYGVYWFVLFFALWITIAFSGPIMTAV